VKSQTSMQLKGIQCDALGQPAYSSERMSLWGSVDAIDSAMGRKWAPTWEDVERHIVSCFETDEQLDGLAGLDGQYFTIFRRQNEYCAFCDRFAISVIYYHVNEYIIRFSRQILSEKPAGLRIPQTKLIQFALMRYVPGRETLFDGILRLMPGECLTIDSETRNISSKAFCIAPQMHYNVLQTFDNGAHFHELFRDALAKRISMHRNDEVLLVPLSGGLDSRYILGTALEIVEPHRLLAVTFGKKGSYDYEYGAQLAVAAGVKHRAYPLTHADFDNNALRAACLDSDGQINFHLEAPVSVYHDWLQFGRLVLSGYCGDLIMGKDFFKKKIANREDIVKSDAMSIAGLHGLGYLSGDAIASGYYYEPADSRSALDRANYWFYVNHLPKYTSYCVFKLRNEFQCINPFMDYAFLDFVLNLSPEQREHRKLYMEWLVRHFPKLAAVPTSTFVGAALTSSKLTKYIALQRNRFEVYLCRRLNRNINKIDFLRYMPQLLDIATLEQCFKNTIPHSLWTHICTGRMSTYQALYGLKCVQIQQDVFGVNVDQA